MNVTVKSGNKKIVTTATTLAKPVRPLTIPVREIGEEELLTLGFRAGMLTMGKDGDVTTGTGLGSDFIVLRWGKKHLLVRGSELLRAWVRQIKAEAADQFPDDVAELPEADR